MELIVARLVLEVACVAGAAGAIGWGAARLRRARRDRDHAVDSLDCVPVRVIVADADMTVCRVNAAASQAGGGDLIGRRLGSLFRDPNALSRILAAPGRREHLEPVSIGGCEALLRLRVLRDANANPCGAAATWTTLAETQDQQRSSLRSTLDRIPLNTLLADRDGHVVHVNGPGIKSLRALYPSHSTDWTGRPLAEIFGAHPRLSTEDERRTCSIGEETVEISALPLIDSHVVTPGWLVVWRVSTTDGAHSETLDRTAQELSSATEQLTVAAVELIANADSASNHANRMLDRTREVTDNTNSVANATEQMSGTINEISLNTRELAEGIARAVAAVDRSREIAEGLRDAGREISRVSDTISSIADQTNLLALNATIEAAGAGEAGRGFAIVANEVKELARETMSATGAIDSQVQSMVKRSELVAEAVSEVAEIVQGVNGLASTLAIAIEEQSTTTNEIASSVSYAAASATQIGREMETLFEAARSSTQTAEGIRSAAEQLNEMARLLDEAKQDLTPRA